MRRRAIICLAAGAALPASPVWAQLSGGLPIDPLETLGRASDAIGAVASPTLAPLGKVVGDVRRLARERARRLARFVSDNGKRVEWDEHRQPSVRGEALLLDPDPAALELAQTRGFVVIEQGTLEALDVHYARLAVPPGVPLAGAIETLRVALPGREITADQLHFPAGYTGSAGIGTAKSDLLPRGGIVGVIDGAIAGSRRLVSQRSFAAGSKPSDHASAIASLLTGAGTAKIYGADVYGSDPAGGNALAIAKALGWMLGQGVPVVSISLVGPSNRLLARAVEAAQAKGMVIVAAVGNDGAAAPPAFPASYPGVVAVTGIDGAGRVLIEAGRASHLDYAAPGADMSALVPGRGRVTLRGTSYAAPLAASRIAARRAQSATSAEALKAADAEALKPSSRTGHGVLCNICRSGI